MSTRYDLDAPFHGPRPPVGAQAEHWLWCLKCKRASLDSEWGSEPIDWNVAPLAWCLMGMSRPSVTPGRCPYEGCDGNIWRTVGWESLRQMCPQLPTEPERGHVYQDIHIYVVS